MRTSLAPKSLSQQRRRCVRKDLAEHQELDFASLLGSAKNASQSRAGSDNPLFWNRLISCPSRAFDAPPLTVTGSPFPAWASFPPSLISGDFCYGDVFSIASRSHKNKRGDKRIFFPSACPRVTLTAAEGVNIERSRECGNSYGDRRVRAVTGQREPSVRSKSAPREPYGFHAGSGERCDKVVCETFGDLAAFPKGLHMVSSVLQTHTELPAYCSWPSSRMTFLPGGGLGLRRSELTARLRTYASCRFAGTGSTAASSFGFSRFPQVENRDHCGSTGNKDLPHVPVMCRSCGDPGATAAPSATDPSRLRGTSTEKLSLLSYSSSVLPLSSSSPFLPLLFSRVFSLVLFLLVLPSPFSCLSPCSVFVVPFRLAEAAAIATHSSAIVSPHLLSPTPFSGTAAGAARRSDLSSCPQSRFSGSVYSRSTDKANSREMESFLRPLQPRTSLFQVLQKGPLKVAVVGSGNWGSVIGKIVAKNAQRSYVFHNDVRMWVFEEMINGKKLTELINSTHENTKYLPGHKLPENLRAVPDIIEACRGADLLVFVMPHQFVASACDKLAQAQVVPPHARAISLLKGLHVEEGRPQLFSETIRAKLGIVECAALSGANVANDVAREEFAEATIGHSPDETDTALVWQQLFDTPYFKVNTLPDIAGVQVCGAVKNVIALAAGFCDGLGLGTNSKSAIIRLGVEEMKQFAMLFFDNVLAETFFDSAGYADVITTVFGGRNARCAAEFVRAKGTKSWDMIEAEMLHGQKLQGTLTAREVYEVITSHQVEHLFPLFAVTYDIAFRGRDPKDLVKVFETDEIRPHKPSEECNVLGLPPLLAGAKKRIGRLQSIVDRERYREDERRIAREFEERYMEIEKAKAADNSGASGRNATCSSK
ncbi:nad-dependent glycerol-3-phosphate dehydrogenase [Cystoisospora suis]|uniref:Glycerol-3-phosphate dehydrogenase [NAD(+)] n=1 Tax=Cystoisospora suis TaxID=483139 RepID=A0A2C6KSS0_9APIC|nr:nad-dependent glycerol-3-phosphate dehydrogenase [Cystoisospora suis]